MKKQANCLRCLKYQEIGAKRHSQITGSLPGGTVANVRPTSHLQRVKQSLKSFVENGFKSNPNTLSGTLVSEVNRVSKRARSIIKSLPDAARSVGPFFLPPQGILAIDPTLLDQCADLRNGSQNISDPWTARIQTSPAT
jgi:hypothetical protein